MKRKRLSYHLRKPKKPNVKESNPKYSEYLAQLLEWKERKIRSFERDELSKLAMEVALIQWHKKCRCISCMVGRKVAANTKDDFLIESVPKLRSCGKTKLEEMVNVLIPIPIDE